MKFGEFITKTVISAVVWTGVATTGYIVATRINTKSALKASMDAVKSAFNSDTDLGE